MIKNHCLKTLTEMFIENTNRVYVSIWVNKTGKAVRQNITGDVKIAVKWIKEVGLRARHGISVKA